MPPGDDNCMHCRPTWALKLRPEVQLDRLTVLGPSHGPIAYDTLQGLIQHGNGWKELHFITPNSSMLGFEINFYWRKPQPRFWHEVLSRRDGASSEASVTIYRSSVPNAPGTVLNSLTRQVFKPNSPEDPKSYGLEEDKDLMDDKKDPRELLVVVKRGHGANVIERNEPPYQVDDMRNWADEMTWADIRRECIDYHRGARADEDEGFKDSFYGK